MRRKHAMPFGAEVLDAGGVRFRLWAPTAQRVELLLEDGRTVRELAPLERGWREHVELAATAGMRYSYRIDGDLVVPDPASRFNPDGVHGSSEVIDPEKFEWRDRDWGGRPWPEAVLYEMHVGTVSPQNNFAGAQLRLDDLAHSGITLLEVMPVAAFSGKSGWGYDGVLPFAPHAPYGRPQAFKRFVQSAHARGIGVLLDVVYNHFGPDGNYLHRYARSFFTDRHRTPWGEAINFDGEASAEVREFFIHNALYWIEEYGLDGLRLDAVHAIRDDSARHIVDELIERVQAGPGRDRHVHIVLENHDNAARLLRRRRSGASDGKGAVSQWNDDFHHAMHVLLTGERDGYYADYADAPVAMLGRILAEGFAYQGERSAFGGNKPRGEPSRDLPPGAFVNFLQNHDQVGNRAFGERLAHLAAPPALSAAYCILLLAPAAPMLFMGEEYSAPQAFLYFCDFAGALAQAVTEGRRREFEGFAAFARPEDRERIPAPCDPATFGRSVLVWPERNLEPHRSRLAQVTRLLELRRRHVVALLPKLCPGQASYERIGERGLVVRWPVDDGSTLVLVANLGGDAAFEHEIRGELLAAAGPPGDHGPGEYPPWQVRWYRAPPETR